MRIGTLAGAMIAAMALAQPGSAGVTPTTKVVVTASGCPGAMRADQHAVGGQRTAWTMALEDKDRKKDEWPSQGSMGVHVVFEGARNQTQSLEFSVSYLPVELRSMPVETKAGGKNAQEMKKSFVLTANDKTRVERDLMVGPAATITRVHLVSATFADGSVWHAANEAACSVEPAHVIAVDGKETSLRW
jgi:hypothetical protein